MLRLFLFIALTISTQLISAQCDTRIEATSQAELDAYNPCPEVESVILDGGDISDLSILQNIISVSDIIIGDCDELSTVSFPNIINISDLAIADCDNLIEVIGFNSVLGNEFDFGLIVELNSNPRLDRVEIFQNYSESKPFSIAITDTNISIFNSFNMLDSIGYVFLSDISTIPVFQNIKDVRHLSIERYLGEQIDFNSDFPNLLSVNEFVLLESVSLLEISSWGSLRNIGTINIYDNLALSSISSIFQLQEPYPVIRTDNNPLLSDCCPLIHPKDEILDISFQNNGAECDLFEIYPSCACNDFFFPTQLSIDTLPFPCAWVPIVEEIVFNGPDIVDVSDLFIVDVLFGTLVIENTSLDTAFFNGYAGGVYDLIIRNNSSLKHVEFKDPNINLNKLIIENNPQLQSFVTEVTFNDQGSYEVVNNPMLNECCFIGSVNLGDPEVAASTKLSGNGQDCNSPAMINTECRCQSRVTIFSPEDLDSLWFCDEMQELVIDGSMWGTDPLGFPDVRIIETLVIRNYDGTFLDIPSTFFISSLTIENVDNIESLQFSRTVGDLTLLNNSKLRRVNDVIWTNLIIENNPSLRFLEGTPVNLSDTEVVHIRNNPNLEVCCIIDGISDFSSSIDIQIENNGADCNSTETIDDSCDCDRDVIAGFQSDLDDINFCRLNTRIEIFNATVGTTVVITDVDLTGVEEVEELIFGRLGLPELDLSTISHIGSLSIVNCRFDDIILNPNLRSINSLSLVDIDGDVSLDCFSGIEITNSLIVDNVESFENVSGFVVSDDVEVIVLNETSIDEIPNFNNVSTLSRFEIADNPQLADISGFFNLTDQNMEKLVIADNPSLSDCCFLSHFSRLDTYDSEISNNGFDCTSYEVILEACECESSISISTQTELDFLVACDSIQGDVIISSDDIFDLSNLHRISFISGDLIIENCPLLEEIIGLSPEVGGRLLISNNARLREIAGFTETILDLEISNNPQLEIVEGFSFDNDSMQLSIIVLDNPLLNSCCFLETIPRSLFDSGAVIVSGNGSDCNTHEEVIFDCSYCEILAPLTTQMEVDALIDCDSILGDLIISGFDIDNLRAVQQISQINGALKIEFCPDLRQIVDFLDVKVRDSIVIRGNSDLTIVRNFHHPQTHVVVEDNSSLRSLTAFSNYRVNRLTLQELRLVNNPELDDCCFLQNYPDFYFNTGIITVAQNGTSCSEKEDILDQFCGCSSRLTFDTQHELNGLNPCDELTSNLVISGEDISDLSNLTHIHTYRDIVIEDCPSLTSVNYFSEATAIDDLVIQECNNLIEIRGIYGQDAEVDVLDINNNDRLQAIELRSSNVIIGELTIQGNPDLQILNSIGSGSLFWDALSVMDNPLLTECCILLLNPSDSIANNGQGCSSRTEINQSCDTTSVSFKYFLDDNEDGIKDSTENYLMIPYGLATVDPSPLFNYIFEEEEHVLVLEYGDYMVIPDLEDFNLTILSDIQMFTIDEDSENMCIDIGVTPNGLNEEVEISVISPNIERCSFTLPLRVKVTNTGNVDLHGQIFFNLTEEFEYVSGSESPVDSTLARLEFAARELPIFESDTIDFQYVFPSADFVGEVFCLSAEFVQENIEVGRGEHCFELRCAVDPNDKHGTPFRGGDDNYTLFEESLEYTIRFENLGNDTAFNIRIEDQLSPYLDHSTFRLVSASHEVSRYELDDGGLLNIFFDNILLPSKEQDTIANKGYVHYTISPMDVLDEFTPVENIAGIFFDFNDPVITNTTLHTYVSELPLDSAVDLDDSKQSLIKLYPVPTRDVIYIEASESMTVQIVDMLGTVLTSYEIRLGVTELDVSDLSTGIYIIRADNGRGYDAQKMIIE